MATDDLYDCEYEAAPVDDQDSREVHPEALECRHQWSPTDLADYPLACKHCGKLTRPDDWHE